MLVKSFKLLLSYFALTVLAPGLPVKAAEMAGMEMGNAAPATIALTLSKAEALALEGNPHIHAADDRARAATRQQSQSLSPADPTLMFESDDAGFYGPSAQQMWSLGEDLGFPGRSIAQADVDGAEAKKQAALAQDTRRMIVLQARQAYWDFYFRQKVSEVLQEAQKSWKVLGAALQSQDQSGQWLSVKAVRMQMETARSFNELFTNSQALQVSQLNLDHLFGLAHGTTYQLAGDPPLPAFTGTEGDYVQKALAVNPEIFAAKREVEAQGARHSLATLNNLPDFSVQVTGSRNPGDSGFSSYGFRVGATLPIFFPLKQNQAAAQAGDELSASRWDLQGQIDETTHMIEDSYVMAESAWRMLELYQNGNLLKQTKRAWESTQQSYHNEQMSLSEFTDNTNTYFQTVTDYYQAQADYGKALAQLNYEVGDLPDAAITEGEK
jgi:outer membrane protein, heavy metal efflux system